MGETRAGFRKANNLILLVFTVVAIVAYFLIPYTNPWLAATIFGLAIFVVLMALFVRFVF